VEGPFFRGFEHWMGADVAIATGWQTVYPVMRLHGCRARVYMVNDHEPEFYPTSIETHLAAASYRLGVPCLAGGGEWMARTLTERYGARVLDVVPYGVDDAYRPRLVERRTDTVVLYGRAVTPRRAVALGLMALEHVHRRRPGLRVVVFGDPTPPEAAFPYEHVGLASPGQLAWLYSEATVGVAFSMTNASLVPQDMLACGLPVVDVAGFGTEAVHGPDGPVELAPFDDLAVAAAVERLLDDPGLRAERRRAGLEHASRRTWERAADCVEAGLRTALRERARSGS
jgi:glycosyltransferase involved in cell wall biosynthesis